MTTATAAVRPPRRDRLVLLGGFLLLSALGFGYLLHGAHGLFTQAGDYRMHWIEARYIWKGVNPADVFARILAEQNHQPVPDNGRPNAVDPKLGPVDGAYPLSSYFTASLLTWPPTFDEGRLLNGVLSLGLFAVTLLWAFRLGREIDAEVGLFLAAAVFAVNSFCTTFIVGQYGMLVVATLVGALYFDRRGQWLLAGLCLGIALVKPSISVPFVLPFLVTRRWPMLFTAGGYLVLGSLVIWPIIHTTPWAAMGGMSAAAGHFEEYGYSLNNLFEWMGMASAPAMKLAAALTMAIAVGLIFLWRDASMLTLYAIASVASRAWSYHRLYDNLVLVFLLLALGLYATGASRRVAWIAFLLLGITLWLPGRLTDHVAWTLLQWAIWVGALIVLLWEEAERRRQAVSDTPSRIQRGPA